MFAIQLILYKCFSFNPKATKPVPIQCKFRGLNSSSFHIFVRRLSLLQCVYMCMCCVQIYASFITLQYINTLIRYFRHMLFLSLWPSLFLLVRGLVFLLITHSFLTRFLVIFGLSTMISTMLISFLDILYLFLAW